MIQYGAGRDKARMTIVREDHHLVLLTLVAHKVKALLDVADDDSIADAVDVHNEIGNVLQKKSKIN